MGREPRSKGFSHPLINKAVFAGVLHILWGQICLKPLQLSPRSSPSGPIALSPILYSSIRRLTAVRFAGGCGRCRKDSRMISIVNWRNPLPGEMKSHQKRKLRLLVHQSWLLSSRFPYQEATRNTIAAGYVVECDVVHRKRWTRWT